MTDIKALRDELGRRNLVCVLNNGVPELTANRSSPTMIYISPENFASKLEDAGLEIDLSTLAMRQKQKKPSKPVVTALPPGNEINPPEPKPPASEKANPKKGLPTLPTPPTKPTSEPKKKTSKKKK